MLNISENEVHHSEDLNRLASLQRIYLPKWHLSFKKLMLVILVIFLFFMFLPWTQNVRADGKVTTLRPEQRPQTINATISGRIEQWYVTEGQAVKKGDTIVHLSEVKAEYFDPALVERMGNQMEAKENAIASYSGKAGALDDQIAAMQSELESKTRQIQNKIQQARLKIESDSLKTVQAKIDLQVAERQFAGSKALYDKGLKSLTDLEEKRLKLQETQTKLVAAGNQLETSRNDLAIYQTELRLVSNETANKVAKTRSDRFSTLSEQYDARATVSKLSIERENYARRQAFYYITAPQDGFIVRAIKPGIGEILKEGDPVVSIQPADYQLAVELYVKPLDLSLLQVGHEVRFLFDGWPAFFFSGWPGVSLGTFGGKIVAMDRNISPNGKFRVLVAPDTSEETWPVALQPGGGAKGIALLNNVPVWYELWRVMNGFPPDLYKGMDNSNSEKESKGK
ncbi:MAG TPA: HlyD family efflux transporter periplasmic adaptor subunit [Saprospiraceae bacterium]|nr:HlyD family efflux transporter periplasmic adaptor subunit [Saprospiraceae bacterium]HPI05141.1 HlyD family efflux transporter periplasmic adaptor subunit [Saprospiraceae bacterium]